MTRLKFGQSSFNRLYREYQKNAKNRKIEFDLSVVDFRSIVIRKCYYCKSQPKNIISVTKGYGKFIYNGIDRKDNKKGYDMFNSVPCCKRCNRSKGTMNEDEFIHMCHLVASNHKDKLQ